MSLTQTYTEEELEQLSAPKHYNNDNGSLYKFALQNGLNAWEYDVIKHLVRCRKKGEWISDIDKCINILKLYKKEQIHLYVNEIEKINK